MRTHCRAERLLTLPRFRDPAEILARRRLIAVAGLLALAAQLLFAPSILILAAAFGLTGRLTRWHPLWLAVPAAAGLLTVLAAGPSRAIAAFAAGSARVAGYFTADAGEPERLLHPLDAYRDARAWLAGQVPLALILAAAEAAALWAIWRLRAGTPLASRPGLVVAARARASAAAIRSGAVVSRTGVRLGVDPATGRPAEVSWREAEGGVLCAGCGPAAAVGSAGPAGAVGSAGPAGATGAAVLAEIGFRFVHAAIRLRKPVVVLDLCGGPGGKAVAGRVAAACRAGGSPLSWVAGGSAPQIDLRRLAAERSAALFSFERGGHEPATARAAGLVVAGLIEVCAEFADLPVRADMLIWISGCDVLDSRLLVDLIGWGRRAGAGVVLGATAGQAMADSLARHVSVLVAGDRPERIGPAWEAAFSTEISPDWPGTAPGEAAVLVRGPHRRLVSRCRLVRARGPAPASPLPPAGQRWPGAPGELWPGEHWPGEHWPGER